MSASASPKAARARILEDIVSEAPKGSRVSCEATRGRLEKLTEALIAASPDSQSEFHRYLATAQREITLPHGSLADHLTDRTVLVTGASGCIGTALLGRLARLSPRRI